MLFNFQTYNSLGQKLFQIELKSVKSIPYTRNIMKTKENPMYILQLAYCSDNLPSLDTAPTGDPILVDISLLAYYFDLRR